MRDRKINLTIEVNPRVIFPEDEEESVHEVSVDEEVQFAPAVPARGDPNKWKIIIRLSTSQGTTTAQYASNY